MNDLFSGCKTLEHEFWPAACWTEGKIEQKKKNLLSLLSYSFILFTLSLLFVSHFDWRVLKKWPFHDTFFLKENMFLSIVLSTLYWKMTRTIISLHPAVFIKKLITEQEMQACAIKNQSLWLMSTFITLFSYIQYSGSYSIKYITVLCFFA